MSEAAAWMIVLGLAVAIVCAVALSEQLDRHARQSALVILHSNELMLARLGHPSDESPQAAVSMVGVILDAPRTPSDAQRRNPTNSSTTGSQASSAR